jgi:segregation and condensation protein B
MSDQLHLQVEALLFASDKSIREDDLYAVLNPGEEEQISLDTIRETIAALVEKYSGHDYAFHLARLNGGYQFLTDKTYYPLINRLLAHRAKKKLSQATIETLAIIAYKQPVTRIEIEQIRGVNCEYTLQKLLEKELIEITGKTDGPGKPILYATSELFMDYFGINSADELPRMKDITTQVNEIGEAQA